RDFRFPHELLRALRPALEATHADAGRDPEPVPPQVERLLQRRLQLAREPLRRIARTQIARQQGELTAAPARQHARARHRFLKAAAGLDHQLIAGRVAERLVDELKAIDGHQEDADAAAATRPQLAQRAIELLHEVIAVREAGEGIVKARAIDALLQALALLDLPHQPLVGGVELAA